MLSTKVLDRMYASPYGDGYCPGWSGGSTDLWRSNAGSTALGDTSLLSIAPRKKAAYALFFNRNTGDPGIKELRGQLAKEVKQLIEANWR
jgi:hypothetical protein